MLVSNLWSSGRQCIKYPLFLALSEVAEWIASEHLEYDVGTVQLSTTFPRCGASACVSVIGCSADVSLGSHLQEAIYFRRHVQVAARQRLDSQCCERLPVWSRPSYVH